ncbi:MAG: peroxidase [Gemmatimonadetes bacterium]|nr:peroxidase [Gemmatimonadota bacterium]
MAPGLTAADAAMLTYAVRLTTSPNAIDADDVQALRDHGFDDTAIHDIAHVTSYYNYVNRMADGLGVELEDSWDEADLLLSRAEFEGRTKSDTPA